MPLLSSLTGEPGDPLQRCMGVDHEAPRLKHLAAQTIPVVNFTIRITCSISTLLATYPVILFVGEYGCLYMCLYITQLYIYFSTVNV